MSVHAAIIGPICKHDTSFHYYVDDTLLYISLNDLVPVDNLVNSISEINDWLVLNIDFGLDTGPKKSIYHLKIIAMITISLQL